MFKISRWIGQRIIVVLMIMAMFSVFGAVQNGLRDNSGTSRGAVKTAGSQVPAMQQLAILGSFEAERTGFEPVMPVSRHTGLAIRRFRPLSHLSVNVPYCRLARACG